MKPRETDLERRRQLAAENIRRLKEQKAKPLELPPLTVPDDKQVRATRRIGPGGKVASYVASKPLAVSLLDLIK